MEVFVAIVDRGSFTGASEKLGMSAPAVSRALNSLETRLARSCLPGQRAQSGRRKRACRISTPAAGCWIPSRTRKQLSRLARTIQSAH
ncbi:LysR family transcriptional regulator [Paraburkholderia sp. LEh10]|uniref:helix-turn-helix domain-containing protein n=1 Tax=Paraburkholderia sp. LEh10 TaxID=2821353 RepID=UPI001FD770F6|nr:LysR family transcriptional regulator [Paraburkholderia sp. LEh10]